MKTAATAPGLPPELPPPARLGWGVMVEMARGWAGNAWWEKTGKDTWPSRQPSTTRCRPVVHVCQSDKTPLQPSVAYSTPAQPSQQ